MKTNALVWYKREIVEKPHNYLRFYVYICIIVVGLVGYFGIKPKVETITNDLKLTKQEQEKVKFLSAKIVSLESAKSKINQNKNVIDSFNENMPSDFAVDKYLVQISQVANQQGLYVDKLIVNERRNNTINIELDIKGNISNAQTFITILESLTRITNINLLDINYGENINNMKLKITAYALIKDTQKKTIDIYLPFDDTIDIEFLRGI